MTRCRVCNCKLKSGDICPRCEYEHNWLNTPEYFCTSSLCGKFLPGATESGLCPECKKLTQTQEQKPVGNCPTCHQKLTRKGHCFSCATKERIERKKKEKEILEMRKIRMSKEKCEVCGHQLTLNGSCRSCLSTAVANKRFGKNPAPKTGAEMTKDVTQASPSAKPGHGFQEVPGVGEYCPEPAASTIHASQPPRTEPIKINEIDVCRQAINKHGISRQLAKAAEEFSEAAAAISRFLAGEGEYAEIICEVADVEVMCLQMRLIYGADVIEQVRAEKVARLQERLKTEF